jgi:hypothetical protein
LKARAYRRCLSNAQEPCRLCLVTVMGGFYVLRRG